MLGWQGCLYDKEGNRWIGGSISKSNGEDLGSEWLHEIVLIFRKTTGVVMTMDKGRLKKVVTYPRKNIRSCAKISPSLAMRWQLIVMERCGSHILTTFEYYFSNVADLSC